MRTGLRGQTRGTFFLARHMTSLHAVPIPFQDRGPVFVDLRLPGSHEWLAGAPWPSSPLEKAEQALLKRITHPGDVVFDIGANIGLHTGLLSRIVGASGAVYSFEPNPQLGRCLEKTVQGMPNSHLYRVALSDEESQAVLYVPLDHTMASLADWTSSLSVGARRQVNCPQMTLDALIDRDGLPAPDVIKCDVEGAELKVFRGASRALNRVDAPLILFEANVHNARGFNVSVGAAREFLGALPLPRFEFFLVRPGGELRPATATELEHANLLAVPDSKKGRIADGRSPRQASGGASSVSPTAALRPAAGMQ
jgi:FkbM family methyltransferase